MLRILLLTFSLLLLFSCDKNDDSPSANSESFSDESFRSLEDFELSASSAIIRADGSMILGGLGVRDLSADNTPFFCKLNTDNQPEFIEFFDFNRTTGYPNVDIAEASNGDFAYLSSENTVGSSNFDGKLIILDPQGGTRRNVTFGQTNRNERGLQARVLPNGNLVATAEIFGGVNTTGFSITEFDPIGETLRHVEIADILFKKIIDIFHFPSDNTFGILALYAISGDTNAEVKMHKLSATGDDIETVSIFTDKSVLNENITAATSTGENILLACSSSANNQNSARGHVFEINSSGEILWENNFDDINGEAVRDIISKTNGNILMLSMSPHVGNGEIDTILSEMDETGNILWRKSYGGDGSDQGSFVSEKADGNIIIVGNTNGFSNTVFNYELFILETNAEGIPIE